ncbi:MAG: hypothetical protein AB1742_13565 [bacterium]
MYFEGKGPGFTDRTLEIAKKEAVGRGVSHVVVASTGGDTGVRAAKLFAGTGVRVVVVTHNTGFKGEAPNEMDPAARAEIERLGGVVHTGTMALRGLGCAVRQMCGNFSHEQIVAATLRIFGEGIKVCVEIAAMASDAGLVPFGDVICVAGTARGADTCALVRANSSNRFFDLKVREIFAKPRDF